jgi:pimeloyl-ACP methyl ester carboxylesterase
MRAPRNGHEQLLWCELRNAFGKGNAMPQFVLVHGAWHGGWCWTRVLPPLRAEGHATHALTLTGVGERAHLLSPGIRLATHLDDVLNLIASEELDDVVLVGHSYGGMVITGVADILQRQRPGTLRHLVYVDAFVPRPGESWSSTQTPEVVAARVAAAQQSSGGLSLPPPDAEAFGLQGADRAWVNRRQTPQPFAVFGDPLAFDAVRIVALPRTYIACTAPPAANVAVSRERARTEPGWRFVEIATGHDPMISAPREFARMLLDCAR